MMTIEKPVLRREIATSFYQPYLELSDVLVLEKEMCDQILQTMFNICVETKLHITTFNNSTDHTDLIIVDNIRKRCLASMLKLKDCIETIECLSILLDADPEYTQYCQFCKDVIDKNKQFLERSQIHFDTTMTKLIS